MRRYDEIINEELSYAQQFVRIDPELASMFCDFAEEWLKLREKYGETEE